ncbi:MAG TPA: hypothetical protein VFT22_02220, partial [Kofleriaceae bacterium]|nr:hypothetical protein [Kofleriaceae bacterium]
MSTSKPPAKPGKGPAKPFLGDEDLSEIDAWVETFDALHMGPDPVASQPPGLDETELVSPSALDHLSDHLSDLSSEEPPPGEPGEIAARALDAAVDEAGPPAELEARPAEDEAPDIEAASPQPAFEHRPPSVTVIDDYAPDPNEADFSEVSAVHAPMPPAPAAASAVPPLPRFPMPAIAGRMPRLHDDDFGDSFDEDDDEVFTSASRPTAAAPSDGAQDEDDLAPPPPPEPRRGPAIVRRTPPPVQVEPREHPPGEAESMFSEQTRVADFTELERRLFSSRDSQPSMQPPVDEDDYADIEVSDDRSESASAPPPPEPQVTSRRTAHVLRRGDTGSRPAPRPPPGAPPIVQRDLDDGFASARPPSPPSSEEDFSDVAAAVGADDDDLSLPELPPRRMMSPVSERSAVVPEIAIEPRPRATLDEALAGLPENEPHPFEDPHEFDEPNAFDPHEFDEPDDFEQGAIDESHAYDGLRPFGERRGFGDPNAFEDRRVFEHGAFEDHGFGEARPFADPNEFDDPDDFRPVKPLPPIEQAVPSLTERARPSRTTPPPIRHDQLSGSETVRGILVAPTADNPNMLRPPALNDLYPRGRTPSSVPPVGGRPAAGAGSPMPGLTPMPGLHAVPGLTPMPDRTPTPPPQPLPGLSPMPGLHQLPPLTPAPQSVQGAQPAVSNRTILEFGPSPALPTHPARSARLATPLPIDPDAPAEIEPTLDLDAIGRDWPEQVEPLPTATLDEACAQSLLVYEREIASLDDSAGSAALRIEAGRLCERLTDFERARGHYDAALMADPRATPALRGLRRLARTSGDLAEAIRHLDAEISVAGALERRPLAHYRVDLMMASNEQDLARVAAGELLDQAPSDVRALLAQLELAFLDGRADEFGVALEQLAQAVTDSELRAALQSARGALAAHHNDTGAAASWFAAAAESDPTALAALLGAIRQATGANQSEAAARALIELARQVEASDPITAAAAAVRAQQWAEGELGQTAAMIAASAAPSDPLVARLAADQLDPTGDPIAGANAFIHWAHNAGSNAERAYAAARAAELDPSRGAELWASAIALDPGDDYAAAQLRTAHVASDATQAAIDVDLAIADDTARDRARLRAAYGMIAQGQLDYAIDVLQQGRAARPGSVAISEALGEALAAAGKWTERAKLFAELADDPGDHLDREVAQLRSALAWEEAVGAVSSPDESGDAALDEATRAVVLSTTAAAFDAWERVLDRGSSPSAHAAALVLASRLGDSGLIGEALVRAQNAERLPLAAASLALRRARLVATEDPHRHDTILRDLAPGFDDPRRTIGLVVGAGRRKELGDAATALEERANLIDGKGSDSEVASLRLRAAQLALDAGEAAKATTLLHKVEQALPQL